MIHHIINKQSKYTLVLLHGTGADEHDLIPLAQSVAPLTSILSLRGRVQENGMNRFFKRINIHEFDLESVAHEAKHITAFLKAAKQKYQIDNFVFLGYSNGATMISALLLEQPELFKGAVLLQPGLLKKDLVFPPNKNLPVFISVSSNDPYLLPPSKEKLIATLEKSFTLNVIEHTRGHSIPQGVLVELYKFLNDNFK